MASVMIAAAVRCLIPARMVMTSLPFVLLRSFLLPTSGTSLTAGARPSIPPCPRQGWRAMLCLPGGRLRVRYDLLRAARPAGTSLPFRRFAPAREPPDRLLPGRDRIEPVALVSDSPIKVFRRGAPSPWERPSEEDNFRRRTGIALSPRISPAELLRTAVARFAQRGQASPTDHRNVHRSGWKQGETTGNEGVHVGLPSPKRPVDDDRGARRNRKGTLLIVLVTARVALTRGMLVPPDPLVYREAPIPAPI